MIRRDLSPAEVRVLGCLIEKQRTTPDQYPLSRNAVRLACNQATNRDPVVDFDEAGVRAALERLGRNGLVRFASARGSRTAKYRHIAGDALGVGEGELALLALLMLRGHQTPGELRGRSERMHHFATVDDVDDALGRLIDAGLVVRFPRRPGQKEDRFGHLLSEQRDDADEEVAPAPPPAEIVHADAAAAAAAPTAPVGEPATPAPAGPRGLEARVSALEDDLRELRRQLGDLLENPEEVP